MGKKKHTEEQRELAIARLTLGDSAAAIAKDLDIPGGTVRWWKSTLSKIKQEDGTEEYHSEEARKFSKKAWQIIHKGLAELEKRLEEAKNPKDLAVVVGILFDKVIRIMPQERMEKAMPLDLSNVSTEHLRIMVADIRRTTRAISPEPEGGTIEGEARGVKSDQSRDG